MCRRKNNIKRIKRLMASVIGISLFTFASEKSVKGYATFYTISEQQERSNWCWVASARGAARAEATVTASQSDGVYAIKKKIVNERGTADETRRVAQFFSPNSDFVEYGNPLSFNQIKACIDNGHIVITLFDPHESNPATSGHIIFVIGYNTNDGSEEVRYCETYDGTTRWYCYDLYCTFAYTPSTIYEYTNSIFCRLK